MKSYVYSFCFLILIGLSSIKLNGQDQTQQQETQTTTTPNQDIQNSNTSGENKTQTQVPQAPKPKPFADDLNIADQFTYAIDKSSNFQDYKVIKQTWITKLRINTLDTLQTLKTSLKTSKELIQVKTKMIDSLRVELSSSQSDLIMKNSFNFLSFMVSKTAYDSIMWAIIIGLLVSLGFMFAAFKRAHSVTSQTKKDLLEIKDEFEIFRKKALKSKEEAVRQLYDELNKYKNMK